MIAWGVLIPGHTPFYLPFLRGVDQVAAESRALTVISVTENNQVKAKLQMQEMMAAGVRGIVVASLGKFVRDEFDTDGPDGAIAIVYCDQPLQEEESIVFDGAGAGYELAAHLAGHGHRRITLMTPTLAYPNMAALHDGMRRATDEGLVEAVDVLGCAGFTVEAGEDAARAALSGSEPPQALVTSADAGDRRHHVRPHARRAHPPRPCPRQLRRHRCDRLRRAADHHRGASRPRDGHPGRPPTRGPDRRRRCRRQDHAARASLGTRQLRTTRLRPGGTRNLARMGLLPDSGKLGHIRSGSHARATAHRPQWSEATRSIH